MEALLRELLTLPELASAADSLRQGDTPVLLSGVCAGHRALLASAIQEELHRPITVLCDREQDAHAFCADYRALTGREAVYLPAREFFVSGATASRTYQQQRLSTLYAVATTEVPLLVTTARAAVQYTVAKDTLLQSTFSLTVGQRYDLPDLLLRLAQAGYARYDQVEGPGQFALRGGILDVYAPNLSAPIRCEFFDDELDTMGYFNALTQRRTENIHSVLLLPAAEESDGETTLWDHLAPDTLLSVCDSARIGETLRTLWEDSRSAEDGEPLLPERDLLARLGGCSVLELDNFTTSRALLPPKVLLQLTAKQLSAYGGSVEALATDLTHYLTAGYRVVVLCGGAVRAKNMLDMLFARGIRVALDEKLSAMPNKNETRIAIGALAAGCEFPTIKLAILTEGQLTESVSGKKRKLRQPRDENRQKLQSYTDLTPGDLVVHTHHGIGRFEGILGMRVDGAQRDYMKISYAGSDCLYVPCTSLDLVSKYICGGEDSQKGPRLNKLGGTEWAKTTYRARAAAKDLADGLIKLYAQRSRLGGYAFSPDSPWQLEFEDAFDYTETDDQLRAIADIKADMEKPVPMDRLLCGDVGYGKTEVALRAVMKCIMDGKQAAILVPTTVLAQQHYVTAMNRFRSFPVTIEVLSRFRTGKQATDILRRVKEGKVDLLIGTHKLLQKNVEFKDLGLLIIDEEQRFGVKHKETLRERTQQVDTLTLSATPIPRTLHMALSGIRDMSAIEEPPHDRQTVQTYVLEHTWPPILDAIRRELARGGQVYYLHNKVESIDSTAYRLQQMLGEDVSIGVAHGKMNEQQLSRVMQELTDGDIQVLVCTTIIETGIDVPNVNTLIIEDADHMGLSQLHQLRGRVGRSARRAYAYLTYRPGKVLTEIAAKRLGAIREYVEFGSGFKIAMRDLEIRGAGNLLGAEQSGYMVTVGYDMYLKLLEEAVLEQQGKAAQIRRECAADIAVSAHIPENYVASAEQRMDLYRRIAAIRTEEDRLDVQDELLDRYGDVPRSVENLLSVALLRAAAAEEGISDVTQKGREILFTFTDKADVPALMAACTLGKYRQKLRLHAADKVKLIYYLPPDHSALDASVELVEDLRLQRNQTGKDPIKEENK